MTMSAMTLRPAIFAVAAVIFSGPGIAQTLPPDCSAAAVPAQPVAISIAGAQFAPKSTKLVSAGGMSMGDQQFDTYRLTLRSEDSLFAPLEGQVTVLVRKGQRVDGKVFRKLPTKSTDKQPSPVSGLPEVQGWSLKNGPAKTDFSHVSYVASLRLEFGQRQGGTIAGKIYLCVPKGQSTMFDSTPSKADSSAIGTFQAQIE
jgi:hypothetical protein